ncbi:hypothetical protein OO184_15435 [Photorhabdus sp. APURE]|uniref:hypothetical protein n=1 Tax=Photorhabdus aballayi TaxID=2991723 RepID=UPI00223DDAEB|nr:hypothetical protein [Photorhabdus aballayi]MCW7549285.1 hypothetical protein [Photorhabdus aballayi]
MFRFILTMILAGRLRHNRALVLCIDAVTTLAIWSTIGGLNNWYVPVCIFVASMLVFAVIGYRNYFLPVRQHKVESVRILRDSPFIYLTLMINQQGELHAYPLPVKTPFGTAYQFYALYVYMKLADCLSQYARKLKQGKAQ